MKLTDRIKKRAAELPAIPEETARSQVVRDAFNFGAQVEQLAAENDELHAKVERMERERERLCTKGQSVTDERDYWRKLAIHWIEKSAHLTATIDGHLAFIQNAACAMQEAKMMADQIVPPVNGVDAVSYVPPEDTVAAPEPTLEEVNRLAGLLQ